MAADVRNSKTILIVEDDADCAQALATLLTVCGHNVRTACNGLDAIELAEEVSPDVAIVDITLPKLNGFSVARRLRSSPETSRLRLIAITGWSQEEMRESAKRAGFDHFLVKPVDPKYLIELLTSEVANA
jgi:CheY-like chemotaxis protein